MAISGILKLQKWPEKMGGGKHGFCGGDGGNMDFVVFFVVGKPSLGRVGRVLGQVLVRVLKGKGVAVGRG